MPSGSFRCSNFSPLSVTVAISVSRGNVIDVAFGDFFSASIAIGKMGTEDV